MIIFHTFLNFCNYYSSFTFLVSWHNLLYISLNLVLPLRQLRKQPRRRTFLPEPETSAERSAKVAMSEAGNGTGALYVLMDAIRDDACRPRPFKCHFQ